jgi:hypothetical protein
MTCFLRARFLRLYVQEVETYLGKDLEDLPRVGPHSITIRLLLGDNTPTYAYCGPESVYVPLYGKYSIALPTVLYCTVLPTVQYCTVL